MNAEQLEGVAADLIAETRLACPADMLLLADACGLLLTPVGAHEERFDGREIRFNARAKHRDQQESVARAIARWAISRLGYFPTEPLVSRFARALQLPRGSFNLVYAVHAPLTDVLRRYTNVNAAVIFARVADVKALARRRAAAPTA